MLPNQNGEANQTPQTENGEALDSKPYEIDTLRMLFQPAENPGARKENLKSYVENIAIHLKPISVQEYLSDENQQLNLLDEIETTQLQNAVMKKGCLGAVVIPAHNEARDITKTIKALNAQIFSDRKRSDQSMEIIIVVNNSTDETAKIAKETVESLTQNPFINFRVIEHDFEESQRGAGAARKLGADLAILRAAKSDNLRWFCIVGLDADNPGILPDHLQKVIKRFEETGANVLSGDLYTSPEEVSEKTGNPQFLALHNAITNAPYVIETLISEATKRNSKKPRKNTSGANHAVMAETYMRIRGYPRRRTGEDSYIGLATEAIGGKIEQLNSQICINPRRIILEGKDYFLGNAWQPDRFMAANADARAGETNRLELDPIVVRERLTIILDRCAADLAKSGAFGENVSWTVAAEIVRSEFRKVCLANGVEEKLIPNSGKFRIHSYAHSQMLDRNEALPFELGKTPVRVAENKADFKLFKVTKQGEFNFMYETVDEAGVSSDDTENYRWVKVNENGIPLIRWPAN